MKFGFDLDGTLDHEEIRVLAAACLTAGHEVHILTGCQNGDQDDWDRKVAKCKRLGVEYTKLHLCAGETDEDAGYVKAQVLRNNGIVFMIDDSPVYVKQMAYYSNARVALVVK